MSNNNNNIRCRTILVLTCKICFNDNNNNNNNIRCRTILVLTCKICFNDNNNNNNNIRCRTILVEPTMLPVKCFLQSQTFPSVHSAYMTKEPLLESFVSCEWWMIIFLLSMFIASSLAENLLPCLHSSPSSRLGAAMSSGKMSSVLMRLMSF